MQQWLSANTTKAIEPSISANNQFIYVIWKDFRHGNPELYFISSSNFGETWNQEKRLTFNNSKITNLYDISLEAQDNRLYIIWTTRKAFVHVGTYWRSVDWLGAGQ